MPGNDDLHAIIADQSETIDQLRAQMAPDYWQGVYDRIRAAWDAWALAELGTSTPSHLDLEGRRELDALWQAIK